MKIAIISQSFFVDGREEEKLILQLLARAEILLLCFTTRKFFIIMQSLVCRPLGSQNRHEAQPQAVLIFSSASSSGHSLNQVAYKLQSKIHRKRKFIPRRTTRRAKIMPPEFLILRVR